MVATVSEASSISAERREPMRVVYFYQYFATPKGSWGTRVYEFARRWAAAGDQVTVITSVYDKSDLRPEGFLTRQSIDGIDVRIVNIRLSNKHGILGRLLSFLGYALVASWHALTLPADVVVASSGPITVGLPGLVAKYLRGRRVVFEVRDLWPDGAIETGVLSNPLVIWLARLFERICYRSADRIVALSDGIADMVSTRAPGRPVEVVTNAADNEFFERADLLTRPETAERPFVLYAGTVGVANSCGQLLEAAEILRDRGITGIDIVILGDGSERKALEARAREQGLTNVRFLGLVPKEEVNAWLMAARASLLVFRNAPILSTSSPNKLFDSLAAGCPVIQNSQGWIRTLLEREQCGLTVPLGDSGALAEAIALLASDDAAQSQMAASSRRVARERFDRSVLAERMRNIVAMAAE